MPLLSPLSLHTV